MNFNKTGFGTLALSGNNAFLGAMTVSTGQLSVQSVNALGQTFGTTATGTTVNSGAAIQLANGVNVGNEFLTLNGVGFVGDQSGTGGTLGALRSVGATASWGTGATRSRSTPAPCSSGRTPPRR